MPRGLKEIIQQLRQSPVLRDGSAKSRFVVRPMAHQDMNAVAKIFTNSFTQREPMNKRLAWKPSDFEDLALDTCKRSLQRGHCLIIEDKQENKPVTFIISEDYNSPLYSNEEFSSHPQLAPVYSLLDKIHSTYHEQLIEEGIIKKEKEKDFGNGRIVHLAYGGTENGYEGKGLLYWLTSEVIHSFMSSGFERAVGVNTSHAARRNLQRFGFTERNQIEYASFIFNNEHVFKDLAKDGNPFCVLQDKILK